MDCYTVGSYSQAIKYAGARAFPLPEHLQPQMQVGGKLETLKAWRARGTPAEKAEIRAWRKAHSWHPHQLRHSAATNLRKTYGLEPAQVINLVFGCQVQHGQAEAYADILESSLCDKQAVELKERAVHLAQTHGNQPENLLAEVESLVSDFRRRPGGRPDDQPAELMEMIPFMRQLAEKQCGTEFLGLNSGFQHVNYICNGLDTGLLALASPPGFGKTTLAWQIACQVAEICRVPVIFVSMEQSKTELRAKVLARFSKILYRHILRGRLRSDDAADLQKLLDAALRYARLGQFLTVIEGDDTTTIDIISQTAAMKMAQAGANRCPVVVDYLQILPLRREDVDRVTNAKDRIDLHVSSLRRMARRLNSPVIAISAENRAGYSKSKGLDVFKESGGIEYSADVAMILTNDKNQPADQKPDHRLMNLNVVKNRNGERGTILFKFYPERAEFVETGREALTEGDEA